MNKLKVCNHLLLAITPAVLAVSIILEASHGGYLFGLQFGTWVALHLVSVFAMTGLVGWHLRMNWGETTEWANKFSGKASGISKVLTVLVSLTILTGLAAIPQFLIHGHSPIGGIHGKTGFIFILISVLHILRHRKWFRK